MRELAELRTSAQSVWLLLVCGTDGVLSLSDSEFDAAVGASAGATPLATPFTVPVGQIVNQNATVNITENGFSPAQVSILVGGTINSYVANPTFDPVAKPGSLYEWYRGNPRRHQIVEAFGELEPLRPEYQDREQRLKVMNEQGLVGVLLFPTIAGVMLQRIAAPQAAGSSP